MRCTTCEYPLWNLKARECPECGTPFRPSTFEFIPNSVAFCCPHCDQAYYGQGESGHLVPAEFECVSCRRRVAMDEMVLRPAAKLNEGQTRPNRMPWFERRERGFFKAWIATIGAALVQPGPMMRGVPIGSSTASAFGFALLSQFLIALGALLPSMCVLSVLPFFIGRMGGGGPQLGSILGVMAGVSGVMLGVMFVAVLAFIGVWGLISHGLLRITGGEVQGIGRTYQSLCYSSGAHAVTIVPCIGPYVGWAWWIVSAVIAIKEAHQVHGGRAAFAVLALPVSVFVVAASLWAVSIAGVMTTAMASSPSVAQIMAPQAEAAALAAEISTYASTHGDAGPGHLLEVMPASASGVGLFISTSGLTSADSILVSDTTLEKFQRFGPELQRTRAAVFAEELPAGVLAHRLGDFVYTGHGIDFGDDDGRLWIVVLALDPAANPGAGADPCYCARLDGTVRRITNEAMAKTLAAQNQLRADYGLGPLPDPRTVTRDRPATDSGPGTPTTGE